MNAHCLKGSSIEMLDLVSGMVLGQPSIEECLSHPVFWGTEKRFLYVSELVRNEMHTQLPSGETLGLPRDWRTEVRLLRSDFDRHMVGSGLRYSSRPADLLWMLRNFYQHPPLFIGWKKENPLTNAAVELKSFPALFVSLFAIFGEMAGV